MITLDLAHFTSEQFSQSILNSGLLLSKHNPPQKSLWLGDGIYFFELGDLRARKVGISLVKNKKNFQGDHVVEINLQIRMNSELVLDMQNDEDIGKIGSYVNKIADRIDNIDAEGSTYFKKSKEKLVHMLKHIKDFLPFNNEYFGDTLGELINVLYFESDIKFEIIACNFNASSKEKYTQNYEEAILYIESGGDMSLNSSRQYCVKNRAFLPDVDLLVLKKHKINV